MPALERYSKREKAWFCLLINVLATPGLGSLMCRRFISGSSQLCLSVAGFVLILTWMIRYFYERALVQLGEPMLETSWEPLLKTGGILFGVAWLWSLVTSVAIVRQAEKATRTERRLPPPIQ